MIKEWVVFNKLEDFNSLLKYTDDDFTPTGKFCYINENGEKLYRKLMKEFYNLRWYPLVVQPLYIGADHPSYISKKVHKISVFMYFRPKKWILQVRFAP